MTNWIDYLKDNLKEIDDLFELREDSKYADGYAYFCKECKQECNVGEMAFACQCGCIIPTYIYCRYGCGAQWNLKISPVLPGLTH